MIGARDRRMSRTGTIATYAVIAARGGVAQINIADVAEASKSWLIEESGRDVPDEGAGASRCQARTASWSFPTPRIRQLWRRQRDKPNEKSRNKYL